MLLSLKMIIHQPITIDFCFPLSSSSVTLLIKVWNSLYIYFVTYRIAGYFRGVYISREHSQSKILENLYVEEARFSISIREM